MQYLFSAAPGTPWLAARSPKAPGRPFGLSARGLATLRAHRTPISEWARASSSIPTDARYFETPPTLAALHFARTDHPAEYPWCSRDRLAPRSTTHRAPARM